MAMSATESLVTKSNLCSSDVNECDSMENPCENQEGDRCVNIKGGYICCDNDVDDERCIRDVNECESNDMCAGVGQWCVNKMGGHICCSSDSQEPECQGVHILKTHDGEILLQYNESRGDVVYQNAGSHLYNTSGGTFITHQGLLKGEGLFPSVNVNRKNGVSVYLFYPKP
ncbi:hypothetical protein ANCDUO_01621 [Ancylostoma duodenale]|uniref:EGF-like calcium-binding domain-containing protein n=1 Tax=Ancylostoma duodenale TaxID=51022 RepID=A0A0C2H2N0_9BILA|nr:hypothetical protein ANCDUO_01621 [Ancylostoma duodenale]